MWHRKCGYFIFLVPTSYFEKKSPPHFCSFLHVLSFLASSPFLSPFLPPPPCVFCSVVEGSTAQGSWRECHAFYQKTEVWRLTSGSYGRAAGYLAKDRGEEGCLSGRASISVLWPSLVPGRRANPARVSAGRGQAPVCFTSYSIRREGCVYPPTDPHTI